MSPYEEWTRIAAAIRGLAQAGELTANLFGGRTQESAGAYKDLADAAESLNIHLSAFGTLLSSTAAEAKSIVARTTTKVKELLATNQGSTDFHLMNVKAAIVVLGRVESQISYLLADREAGLRALAERSFMHLQRSIVVDETLRKRWVAAYQKHETECEKLGAVHLLSHGLWAFKVDAQGARTDLVFQEPIRDVGAASRASEGLVLTEWKKLPSGETDGAGSFRQGRIQGNLYVQGALGGTELSRTRYVVVVSEKQIAVPSDVTDQGGVTYRHVNIAVSPLTPSKVKVSA